MDGKHWPRRLVVNVDGTSDKSRQSSRTEKHSGRQRVERHDGQLRLPAFLDDADLRKTAEAAAHGRQDFVRPM